MVLNRLYSSPLELSSVKNHSPLKLVLGTLRIQGRTSTSCSITPITHPKASQGRTPGQILVLRWGNVEPWGHFGGHVGPSWHMLAPSRPIMGPSWGHDGPCLCWDIFMPFWTHVVVSSFLPGQFLVLALLNLGTLRIPVMCKIAFTSLIVPQPS